MALPTSLKNILNNSIVEQARVEYKRDWNPKTILHTICAFANRPHQDRADGHQSGAGLPGVFHELHFCGRATLPGDPDRHDPRLRERDLHDPGL